MNHHPPYPFVTCHTFNFPHSRPCTQQLLGGAAVIAISSLDRETGCYSYWDDAFDVIDIVTEWRDEWG